MLPASGYLVLAWKSDNPGAWLMHCHIGWHVSLGLSLQWIEQQSSIPALYQNSTDQTTSLSQVCTNWDSGSSSHEIVQDDSGV